MASIAPGAASPYPTGIPHPSEPPASSQPERWRLPWRRRQCQPSTGIVHENGNKWTHSLLSLNTKAQPRQPSSRQPTLADEFPRVPRIIVVAALESPPTTIAGAPQATRRSMLRMRRAAGPERRRRRGRRWPRRRACAGLRLEPRGTGLRARCCRGRRRRGGRGGALWCGDGTSFAFGTQP